MKQYQNVYMENQIMTASPAKLIALLYDGAVDFIEKAKENIKAKDYISANENIKKAQDIIMELNLSLDIERGGEKRGASQTCYRDHQSSAQFHSQGSAKD